MKALRVHFSSNNFGRLALAIAGFLATTPVVNAIPIEITSMSPTTWPSSQEGNPLTWSAGAVWANDRSEAVHVEYITFGLWNDFKWPEPNYLVNYLITTETRYYSTVVPPHERAGVDLPATVVPPYIVKGAWDASYFKGDLNLFTTVENFYGYTEDAFGNKAYFSWSVPDHGATIWLLFSTLLLLPTLTMVGFLARPNVKRQA